MHRVKFSMYELTLHVNVFFHVTANFFQNSWWTPRNAQTLNWKLPFKCSAMWRTSLGSAPSASVAADLSTEWNSSNLPSFLYVGSKETRLMYFFAITLDLAWKLCAEIHITGICKWFYFWFNSAVADILFWVCFSAKNGVGREEQFNCELFFRKLSAFAIPPMSSGIN